MRAGLRTRNLVASAAAIGIVATPASVGAQERQAVDAPAVAVTELGGESAGFVPAQINGRGQVLGRRHAAATDGDISVWDAGRFVQLAPPAAPTGSGQPRTTAFLNERGEVALATRTFVGGAPIGCTNTRWAAGRVTVISAWDNACVSGLSDHGQVVFSPILASPNGWLTRVSAWSDGRRVWSPTPAPAGSSYYAEAVGPTGLTAGYVAGDGGRPTAAVWQPGNGVVTLGTLGGTYSEARAVTDDGTVAGTSATADGNVHVFTWRPETGLTDIGLPAGSSSILLLGVTGGGDIVVDGGTSTFVNDQGQTVTRIGGTTYLWRDGTFTEVENDPQLRYRGANDRGQVILDTAVRDALGVRRSPTSKAYLWDDGRLVDLDAAVGGDGTSTAEAINDLGQVVGTDGNGTAEGPRRGVLWTVTPGD